MCRAITKHQRGEECSLVHDYRPLDQIGQHVEKKEESTNIKVNLLFAYNNQQNTCLDVTAKVAKATKNSKCFGIIVYLVFFQ